jgi:hypothetical protein
VFSVSDPVGHKDEKWVPYVPWFHPLPIGCISSKTHTLVERLARLINDLRSFADAGQARKKAKLPFRFLD